MKNGMPRGIARLSDRAMQFIVTKIVIHRGRKAMRDLDTNSRNAEKISEKLLLSILKKNKNTEYGRLHHFKKIHTIQDYQKMVPLSCYDEYQPFIQRMVEDDEQNLLTVERPAHYALTSGSIGVPKHIPVSQAEIDKYNKYATSILFGVLDEYYRNTTGKGLKYGLGLNTIELRFQETPHGIPKGAISGNTMKGLQPIIGHFLMPPWDVICPQTDMDLKYFRARFALERREITFIDGAFMSSLVDMADYMKANWQLLCSDIRTGKISEDIKVDKEWREKFSAMFRPNPRRAAELEREFQKGMEKIFPRIWKNFQAVCSIGTGGFATYSRKMRLYTGKNIPFENLTYAASEGLFATARHVNETSYVLIPDGGFYEFIPEKSEDPSEILTMEKLEVGERYEVVVTNLSGFYRYRIGDVVRVTGYYNEAPMLQFVYRKSQMLSIAGEKTNEEAVRWCIDKFIEDTGVNVLDYSVYADTDTEPGHYVFLMEPDHIIPEADIPRLRDAIDARMMQANPSYGAKVRSGVLKPMELIFVQQDTYQLYRELMIVKGVSANQLKPVRVIDTPIKKKFFFGLQERY